MTLPALLSTLSPKTSRFVTVGGRIVTGGVSSDARGRPRHPEHGPVTPVPPHTNHGGALPEVAPDPPWWVDHPEVLRAEIAAMARAFRGFKLHEVDGAPAWVGTLNTGRGRFGVTVVHRPDHGLPYVRPDRPGRFQRHEGPRTVKSPHLYVNGDLCVAGQDDWDPDSHDATTVLAWTAHWLATFTEWRITGRGWPCEGVSDAVA